MLYRQTLAWSLLCVSHFTADRQHERAAKLILNTTHINGWSFESQQFRFTQLHSPVPRLALDRTLANSGKTRIGINGEGDLNGELSLAVGRRIESHHQAASAGGGEGRMIGLRLELELQLRRGSLNLIWVERYSVSSEFFTLVFFDLGTSHSSQFLFKIINRDVLFRASSDGGVMPLPRPWSHSPVFVSHGSASGLDLN